jgi:RHS repeat-associated protein
MQRDTGMVVPARVFGASDPRRITFPNNAYRGFYYGRVMYTHGGGIDAPLSLTRMEYSDSLYQAATITPTADWRGSYDYGTGMPCRQIEVTQRIQEPHTEPGMPQEPTSYENHCIEVDWPAPHIWITRARRDTDYLGPRSWVGSLVGEQRDASGQMYRRNRYYDPNSGRFTQEDPIGIAGGLNVYGFANGDPVSYSDPYGLCPPKDDNLADCPVGSRAGQEATEFWAERYNNADNMGGKVATGAMGLLASLWTPETATETGMTIAGAGAGTAAQAASRVGAVRNLLNNRLIGSAQNVAVNIKFNPSERSVNVIAGSRRVLDVGVHAIGKSPLGAARQVPHIGVGAQAGKHVVKQLFWGIRFIR